jgi:EpsI family protein
MPDPFKSGAVRLATLLLIAQAAVLYSSIRPEAVPAGKPLAEFPKTIGDWQLFREGVVEPEIQEILKADDLLNRDYLAAGSRVPVNLFIAAFRSQRNGKAPHSPKNCLPGSGWTQVNAAEVPIDVGLPQPVVVNRYEVQHSDSHALVFYWYQSRDRIVANEFRAKFWVVADAIRLNRTDTALVRITVPILNQDSAAAERSAVGLAHSAYSTIRSFLPN